MFFAYDAVHDQQCQFHLTKNRGNFEFAHNLKTIFSLFFLPTFSQNSRRFQRGIIIKYRFFTINISISTSVVLYQKVNIPQKFIYRSPTLPTKATLIFRLINDNNDKIDLYVAE